MTSRRALLLTGIASAALAGCATGATVGDSAARIPPIPSGQGRIWFYRSGMPVGVAVQPSVYLNGTIVGRSIPNGAYFRDMPPGDYRVTATTEATRALTFTLGAGEERFVRTYPIPGLFIGQIGSELVDAAEARSDIASKSLVSGS